MTTIIKRDDDVMWKSILANRMMWQDPIAANRAQQLITNAPTLLSRQALLAGNLDPRRNIDDECGYPTEIDRNDYRILYDREPIAARVVQVFPLECWQNHPSIYEDEDVDNITPFEQAWHDLPKNLRGESYYQDEEGNPVFEILTRADIGSGIGTFGCILIGVDDGRRLDEPIEGFEDSPQTMGAMQSLYGSEAQFGAITLMPGKEKPKLPYTVNTFVVHDTNGQDWEYVANTGMEAVKMFYDDRPRGRVDYVMLVNDALNTPPFPKQQQDQLDERRRRMEPETEAFRKAQNDIDFEEDEDSGSDPPDNEHFNGQDRRALQRDSNDLPPGQLGHSGNFETGADDNMDLIDTQDEPDVDDDVKPIQTPRKLLFLRSYDETLVYVVQYESDPTNVRFGHPVMYNITLNDPRTLHGGTGLSMTIAKVHWSRVIHIADNLLNSEIFGEPRMKPVFNRLLDIRKLHGGSAEMYWRGAFPGYSLETHPQLGGDVQFDSQDILDQMEQYMNGLQRYVAIAGMSMKGQAPQVVDPTPQIEVQIEAICIRLGVPIRVFKGSERGELASSQDDQTWNDRLRQRQNGYITPRIIVPFIDRLIKIGVLPKPNGFSVVWPDLNASSDIEKAQRAAQLAQAIATYVSGQLEKVMTFQDFLVRICKFDEEEAREIVEAAQENAASGDMMSMDPEMDQELHDATVEQMTNPDLVPDNIQTGDQHHYEAGSMDKQAELEHQRIMDSKEQMGGLPGTDSQMPPGAPPQMGGGKPPMGKGKLPPAGKKSMGAVAKKNMKKPPKGKL